MGNMRCIHTVLFDADGVLQRRPPGWHNSLETLFGFRGNGNTFLEHLWVAEEQALAGKVSFIDSLLPAILADWECQVSIDTALEAWTMLDVDQGIADVVRSLRSEGTACHLASNQEAYRAEYMSNQLGYRELFEKEFYSCHLGQKKPDGEFFTAILNSIAAPADRVLFIDDRQENVDKARQVGLHGATFSLESGPHELQGLLRHFGLDANATVG